MSLRAFFPKAKPPSAFPLAGWLFSTGSRSACKETVYRKERETGLEPATACLEGRYLQVHRSLLMKWLQEGVYTIRIKGERAC
jgi:hypothetical protein